MILTTIGHLYRTVGSRTFNFTGSLQTWVVPDGITSISANVIGAIGGTIQAYRGGYGANLTATIPVTPGQTLYLVVGEAGSGKSYINKPTPTYGGGGVGGDRGQGGGNGAAGGGLSGIFTGSTPSQANALIIAGGGGGVGGALQNLTFDGRYDGGDAGNASPGSGSNGHSDASYLTSGGGGATTSGGGAAGVQVNSGYTAPTAGSALLGGNGGLVGASNVIAYGGGGGGGGGYYGGGGGAYGSTAFGGGGGGSSFSLYTVTYGTHNIYGNGSIVITW